MDCSPPSSSVHGISQARILEWVAISFSGGSSWPRDQIHVSCIGRQVLYPWITREAWNISQSNKIEHSNHKKSREGARACDSNPSRERKALSLSPPLSLPFSLISLSLCYSKSHFSWVLCLKICLLVKFICNPDHFCSILIVICGHAQSGENLSHAFPAKVKLDDILLSGLSSHIMKNCPFLKSI